MPPAHDYPSVALSDGVQLNKFPITEALGDVLLIGLDQTAVVRTIGAGGDYSVTANAALVCRLMHHSEPGGGPSVGPDREELANLRRLLWDGIYQLSETAQLEVSGERFNVRAGTIAYMRGPDSTVEYGRAEVVRAV